jgi:PIN domain nuclease of toxin-antitoxin system
MRLLLDTHTFLFAINRWENLSHKAKQALEDPANERWLSTITLGEIAIKVKIGKLPLSSDRQFYLNHIDALSARILSVEIDHTFEMFHLPLHHRDPFDRMLIAQAKAEGLTLISRDRVFARYGVEVLW